jgi:3-deoxy-D-manno-octulosonic-acid transferase
MTAMLWLYRVLFVPVLLALMPVYLWRMYRRGGYARHFAQRFGAHPHFQPKTPGRPRIWLQAVSVGEVLAIGPLLEALRSDGAEVYLTTTTSTGFKLATERYRELTVGIGYFPLDVWPFVARAWRRIAPDLLILTEGERWPEHLHRAAAEGVPVLNINARLSDRSYRRLRRFPALARALFANVTRVLPCSAQDEARLIELGVPREKLLTTGNIKLDVPIVPLTDAAREALRGELGLGSGLVLLGSSTWPGEEAALVEVLRAARANGIDCSLLLVPRHAERRGEVDRLLQGTGLLYHLRSRGRASGVVDIAVGDTTGELRKFTQLADVVFVGKSLPPNAGGQTPVEAAALQKPIVFGPEMSNFRVLAQNLVDRGAAVRVPDAGGLVQTALELMRDARWREELSTAAAAWRRENSGAVARTLEVIRAEMRRGGSVSAGVSSPRLG